MDEMEASTVLRPHKTVAHMGEKWVGSAVSTEQGEMITVDATVNTNTNFSQKLFREHLICDGSSSYTGVGNKSRWQIEEKFATFIKYFILHTHPENSILIFGNCSWHISCEVLDIRKMGAIVANYPKWCRNLPRLWGILQHMHSFWKIEIVIYHIRLLPCFYEI